MLFYVTMGCKHLRHFVRLGGRVYKVIIGLWLRLKYKWLGYGVLGLYKHGDFNTQYAMGYTLDTPNLYYTIRGL